MTERPWRLEVLRDGAWVIKSTFSTEERAEARRMEWITAGVVTPEDSRVIKHVEFESEQ